MRTGLLFRVYPITLLLLSHSLTGFVLDAPPFMQCIRLSDSQRHLLFGNNNLVSDLFFHFSCQTLAVNHCKNH
jgi:hypothetical protein